MLHRPVEPAPPSRHLAWREIQYSVYNGVGVVKLFGRHPFFSSRERSPGGPDVFVGPFIARPLTLRTIRSMTSTAKLRPYREPFAACDQVPLFNPAGEVSSTDRISINRHHSPVHSSVSSEEAGRSIEKRDTSSATTGNPAPSWNGGTRAALHAASHTAAPPTFVQWLPWPPHGRGGTSIADSPAILDRGARPSRLLRPAKTAPWSCLAY